MLVCSLSGSFSHFTIAVVSAQSQNMVNMVQVMIQRHVSDFVTLHCKMLVNRNTSTETTIMMSVTPVFKAKEG